MAITNLLKNKLKITKHTVGNIGLERVKEILKDEECSHFTSIDRCGIWSNQIIQTFLYEVDNKYFLELSPSYKWIYSEDIQGNITSAEFEEYEKNYKPLVVAELSKETLLDWKKKCEDIFDQVGISYT